MLLWSRHVCHKKMKIKKSSLSGKRSRWKTSLRLWPNKDMIWSTTHSVSSRFAFLVCSCFPPSNNPVPLLYECVTANPIYNWFGFIFVVFVACVYWSLVHYFVPQQDDLVLFFRISSQTNRATSIKCRNTYQNSTSFWKEGATGIATSSLMPCKRHVLNTLNETNYCENEYVICLPHHTLTVVLYVYTPWSWAFDSIITTQSMMCVKHYIYCSLKVEFICTLQNLIIIFM